MAPIVATAASADEVAELNVTGIALSKGVGEPSDGTVEPQLGENQSNLFAEESSSDIGGGGVRQLSSIDTSYFPPLALMPSSSPTSSAATPSSLVEIGLEETNAGALQFESAWIQNQVDADEALARQLQAEEDKKRPAPKAKAKVNVVPSLADEIFGEPLTWEVRGNYTKVTGKSSAEEVADSISDSLSTAFSSFKKWGNGMTAAANDFFGEDVAMQVRTSSTRRSEGQYRNEL